MTHRAAVRLIGGAVLSGVMLWPVWAGALEETVQKKPALPVGKTLEVTVEKDSFAFAPQTVSVHVGDVVRWTNHDAQKHLVVTQDPKGATQQLLIYHTIQPGESYEFQFERADDYNFFCAIHFQMWGSINVAP
ncbi:MAG: cupredoxin domain-containing protein [Nitrospirae bacterium]|nr:cupredoxin domain-containing protein [Nitrospirota bacterium]